MQERRSIPYDFRRTAVRDLVNAGVPEWIVMQMAGHKTGSVFDHYHVVSPADVERAAALLDAKLTADQAAHAAGHNLGTGTPIGAGPEAASSAKEPNAKGGT